MAKIHPSAVIHPNAKIADDVEIGPFCSVGEHVEIGSGTRLISHVVVDGVTKIGQRNTIYPFAALGLLAQHKRSNAPDAQLIIGDDNTFREHVTAHVGSDVDNKITIIGNRNLFLVASHIAHDCVLGDDIVMSNNATLAGHVHVGNKAIIGGLAAVLQFTRIGEGAMIGGMCGVTRDIITYGLMMGGIRQGLSGLNLIGLQRAGVEKENIMMMQQAYKALFNKDNGTFTERIALVEQNDVWMQNPLIKAQIEFVKNPSKNNILQPD
ncbi:MAG: acyl-ACP--UDP-N-acetylglucosamine O-acyltransferase [Alphaproteobacteria bacterium]|nr:acyl-ACP--UDP-N-acetylglucosamine O-acyltransferase [Alphaproteobacteria bacterium]